MSFWRQSPAARRWLTIIGWQTQIGPGPGSSRMQAKQLLVRTPAGSLHTTVALPDWADMDARFGSRRDVVLAVEVCDLKYHLPRDTPLHGTLCDLGSHLHLDSQHA